MDEIDYWDIDNLAKTIDNQLNIEYREDTVNLKKEIDKNLSIKGKRTVIRNLYLLIDVSASMKVKDIKPSRLVCTIEFLQSFLEDFYDKNPLSTLGFGIMKDSKFYQVSDLSQHSKVHFSKLNELKENDTQEISIQNSLEIAIDLLRDSPLYSSKEVLVISGANATCDPGDIAETIERLRAQKIKVSFITLSCKLFVCKKIAEETGGSYDLASSKDKYREILLKHSNPIEITTEYIQSTLIPIGFPQEVIHLRKRERKQEYLQFQCCCHDQKLGNQHYVCPRCEGLNCDVPSKCGNCDLNLIKAPMLARTFHQLNPLKKFQLIRIINDMIPEETKDDCMNLKLKEVESRQRSCLGCECEFKASFKSEPYISQCTRCNSLFCLKCDIFIHDSLYNCPGCL